MTRFWLRFIAVCSFLAGMFFVAIGRMGQDDTLAIFAAVCLVVTLIASLVASRCPHCGHIHRYGMWNNYCSKCGCSMDD